MAKQPRTLQPHAPKNLVGSQVRRLRESKGWAQQELAERLQRHGVRADRYTVIKVEGGERTVTDIELVALANIFGVGIEGVLTSGRTRV